MRYSRSSQFYTEEDYFEIVLHFVDAFFLLIAEPLPTFTSDKLCLFKLLFLRPIMLLICTHLMHHEKTSQSNRPSQTIMKFKKTRLSNIYSVCYLNLTFCKYLLELLLLKNF